MTVKAGILLYLLYLLLEIFLVLFLGIPFAAVGVGFALTRADGWIIGSPIFLAIAALVFWGVYKLDRRRRSDSKEIQEAQRRTAIHNVQLQANAEEAKRALEAAEKERDELREKVAALNKENVLIQQTADSLQAEKEELSKSESDLKQRLKALSKEKASLKSSVTALQTEKIRLIQAQEKQDSENARQRDALLLKVQSLSAECEALNQAIEFSAHRDDASLYIPETSYKELASSEIKNSLIVLRSKQDEMAHDGTAVIAFGATPQKVANAQIKQILRCFNAECDNIISNVSARNIDSSREKIQRAFDANNRIFLIDGVQLTLDYLAAKLDELNTVYTYHLKLEEEREQKRAIREQMVEEEKVRREIEREKKKIERDQQQFEQEVRRLMKYMQKTTSDVEKQLYIDKIHELEEKLHALEENKKVVLDRENNAKAGFVYIISNIGSFGEHVFKIGMTRRLEPMDRIAELSSASVPFPFDVHAMIFSENAPELEAMLHRHFESRKVNKVNSRKEFFRVDLEEIKKLVIEQFGNTVKFTDIPSANEYRETLRLEGLSK